MDADNIGTMGCIVIFALTAAPVASQGTNASGGTSAAMAAIIGGVVAAGVSLIGYALKYSIDTRAELRQTLTAERVAVTETNNARRAEIEAATSVVQLFVTANGSLSPPTQRAAALFMLFRLGQDDLSVALLDELMAKNEITPSAAAGLIDLALRSKSNSMHRKAIDIMYDRTDYFLTQKGFELPSCILDDIRDADEYVRDWGPVIIARLLALRPLSEWLEMPYDTNTLIGALCNAWADESVERVKNDTAAIVQAALLAFPMVPSLLESRTGTVKVSDARSGTSSARANSDVTKAALLRLETWRRAGVQ